MVKQTLQSPINDLFTAKNRTKLLPACPNCKEPLSKDNLLVIFPSNFGHINDEYEQIKEMQPSIYDLKAKSDSLDVATIDVHKFSCCGFKIKHSDFGKVLVQLREPNNFMKLRDKDELDLINCVFCIETHTVPLEELMMIFEDQKHALVEGMLNYLMKVLE
jgi:hypothetical protein